MGYCYPTQMTSLRMVLLTAVWAGVTLGQFSSGTPAQTAPAAKHEVTGVVLNAVTGEPVQRALVTLQTPSGQNAAFSDASGHFTLAGRCGWDVWSSMPKAGFRRTRQRRLYVPADHRRGQHRTGRHQTRSFGSNLRPSSGRSRIAGGRHHGPIAIGGYR